MAKGGFGPTPAIETPILDAHCHLSQSATLPLAAALLAHAAAHGVDGVFLGGTNPKEWQNQESLAKQYPRRIHCLFGIHPWQIPFLAPELAETWLLALAAKIETAFGVGEIGLDFSTPELKGASTRQMEVCERQFDLAARSGKPLLLHVVRAHQEMLALVRRWRLGCKGGVPSAIVHGFRGSRQLAAQYLDEGLFLSFGPGLLAANRDETLIRFVPADRLLVESDAPQKRGQHPFASHPDGAIAIDGSWYTSPAAILAVGQVIGDIRGVDAREILWQSGSHLGHIFYGKP